ncbi:putative protein N(5)-glutamine methyltransferase [Streptomyces sp. SID1034]|uniref:putative protein N(5)-glutamine methyltransferase n=1 Tax=Streptomyces sp. SID1034 TaxID=2690248 RepID=UPI001371D6BC|nr:putative protein N(5)-glutamine methyltransferase [Streptomyces sp. SID1034]MYV94604.1 putative protein N(5)-glutamine methyltransferase [Streptomyces sp. SID1034]
MTVEPVSVADVVSRLRAAGCVFAEDEAELILGTADGPAQVASMVERRASGLPLEHVLGWAEFHGLRVAVDPGVFVPRRRTEFLVHQALAAAASRPLVVVDLCCGSGALGAALAAALPGAELHAADIEPAAVRCARRNVAPFGGRVYEGDLFAALPAGLRGRIDILTANVPYVPSDEVGLLPAEAREHEPLVALDGGSDGLDIMRRVALAAPDWLAPGGVLLTETSERQVPGALAAVSAGGLRARLVTSDELYANVVTGVRE